MALSVAPPLVGRRFSMDVSEELLAQIGARGLEVAVEQFGRHVAHEHIGDIQHAVDAYLLDAAWVKPIIEQELRRTVREFVLSLWSDDEKRNLRNWFDVFTAKCRTDSPQAADAVDPSAASPGESKGRKL